MELARAYITVRADLSQLKADFDRLKSQTNDTIEDIAQSASKRLSASLIVAGAMFAAVAYFGKQFLDRGSAVHDQLETIEVDLRRMMGSVKEASDMMDRLELFSRESAMPIPELYEMSKSLINMGKSGDDVIATMRLLGDASGGTVKDFHQLAAVYGKMLQGGGTGSSKMISQLQKSGIITVKDFAEQLGKSEEEIKDMTKTGRIGIGELTKVMKGMTAEGGRNFEALKKQASAGERLAAAYKYAVDMLSKKLFEPLDPYIDAVTVALTKLTHALTDLMAWGGKPFAFMFFGVVAAAALSVALIGLAASLAAVGAMAGAAVMFLPELLAAALPVLAIAAGVVAVVLAIGAAIGLLAAVVDIPKLIGDAWEYMKSVFERTGMMGVIYDLMDIWSRLIDVISMGLAYVVKLFAPAGTTVAQFFDGMLVGGLKTFIEMVSFITDFVLDVLETLIVIGNHWDMLWDNSSLILAGVFMYMNDIVGNAMTLMVESVRNSFRDILTIALRTMIEFAIIMTKISTTGTLSTAMEDQMRESGKAAARGILKGTGLDKKPSGVGLMDMSNKTKKFYDESGIGDIGDDMLREKKELENNRRRVVKPGFGAGKAGDEGESHPGKSGMSSIEDFGKMIQQSILKEDAVVVAIEKGNDLALSQLRLATEQANKPMPFVVV